MKDQLEGLQSTQHSSQASIFAHTLKFGNLIFLFYFILLFMTFMKNIK